MACMTTLIIVRHGNTFEKGETPRRAGARTDLPLTETGRSQGRAIGQWLKTNGYYPEAVYCSQLQRTKETAEQALQEAGYKEPVFPLAIFNEVDYGPDEDLPEDAVVARLGEQALHDWDKKAIVPDGWLFDPQKCIEDWKNFASHIVEDKQDCVMVATSNGVARFAPYITGDFEAFSRDHSIKISTGAICVLKYDNGRWSVIDWNVKPTC
ncbi:MAG: histidine phosphatase family protein [Micavibrio aeruginosavorus]|uniref:phosphoglycerate mutase (2,3-diphosphoglycerate-dependent) n=1 Tax=Micavibrio aeruginosavorus TaxID=349221 RepID=A0A2W5N1J2_9BACT|nr:MAG: histidine phosphatase family protein [Micavibrio aeruginosavorus]